MKVTTKKLSDILSSRGFIFAIAAISMLILTFNIDLISSSQDAIETWKVSKTFFSDDKYYSYVMYKGLYAFVPCIIDYFVTTAIGIPNLILFKIFNALSFGYVATIGMPFLVNSIHGNKNNTVWQRYLFVAVLLLFERSINYNISVDMMSCALFVLLCNSVIKVSSEDKPRWSNLFCVGLLFGLNMCLSGQFSISTVIVIGAFIIGLAYKHFKINRIPQIKKHGALMASIILVFVGFIIARMPNQLYLDLVVWPAKAAGEWIPTGEEWIINGLSANLLIINFPECVPDYLGLKLLTEEQIAKINAGGSVFTYSDYFKLVLKEPVLFLMRWSERLFLGMFNDPENSREFITENAVRFNAKALLEDAHIISMAVIIYGFYDRFKARFKKYKDFISLEMAIYIGFLFSALVPSFGHVENRYFFTARCLVYGVFIMSPFFSDGFVSLKQKIKNKDLDTVSYRFWGCLLFVLMSLIIYYAIYQSMGV